MCSEIDNNYTNVNFLWSFQPLCLHNLNKRPESESSKKPSNIKRSSPQKKIRQELQLSNELQALQTVALDKANKMSTKDK
jgi:hypothetical protein